jgi:hypothetical protein
MTLPDLDDPEPGQEGSELTQVLTGEQPGGGRRLIDAGTFVILMTVASALGLAKVVVFGKILGVCTPSGTAG